MPGHTPKIAIVCDFLTTMGGAENVILAIHEVFPDAPIYTALYDEKNMPRFRGIDVRPSKLQQLPKVVRKYHKLLPTFASKAMKRLDLAEFDIILTSSYLHANHITKSRSDQVIISYCHTPARYYWSHYDEYRRDPGYGRMNFFIQMLMPLMVPKQRRIDYIAAQKVDAFIANSNESKKRIKKYYGRSSTVLHPPVDTARFTPQRQRGEHYVTTGRQLPYKRHDLAVRAATKLNKKLIVFGNGPMHDKLVAIGGPTVEFRTDRYGNASDAELEKTFSTAKGFIFPAEEDFGIVSIEALASGTPVIGYAKGGTTDIVTSDDLGVLFQHQSVEDVIEAVKSAEQMRFFPSRLHRASKRFDISLFRTKLRKIVADNSPV